MKKTIIIILLILSQTAIFSQGGWEVIYPGVSIYGSLFKDAAFFDDNNGWVLTQLDVRKTTNSSQNWSKYRFSEISNNYMNCFQFLNINTGWVNVDKYLKFTSNSGDNWLTVDSTFYGVKDFYFLDPANGWLCGNNGIIKKTTNGGYTWNSLNSGTSNKLNAVAFADNNFGVSGGDWGTILWTVNGGLNWNIFTDVYTNFFTNVRFLNSQTGFVTGTGNILYRTTNRGSNWEPYFSNFSIQNSIQINSESSVFVFGSPLAYLKSTNSGGSWNQNSANGLFAQSFAVSITPSNNFWCAADSGIIFRSTNNGNDWYVAYRENITSENLKSVYFVNQSTGIAAGNLGVLLKTTNGGINWANQNLGTENTLNSIQFVNSDTGFIAGGRGYYFGVVYKTTNRGSSWQQVYLDSMQLNSIHFINPSTGWCVGNNRAMIKTTNAGNSWVKTLITTAPQQTYIYDLFFINENTGFIGGNGMFKTTNGGLNWYRVLINTTQSIQFIGNTGFAVTSAAGNFMKSTNTGENWTSYPTGGSYRGDLFFINTETGWVNTPSIIRKTTNGGVNWNLQNTANNSIPVNSIFFIDENHGWVVGNYGGIMRTTNGGIGITQISTEIPRSYILFQNYPNPFNPVTKIRFSIPAFSGTTRQVVSLKIYDVLGKEVVTLVNEMLNPGPYQVEWNASNFSSGIYFYSLITNEFTQTKKMVVLK